MCGGMHQIWAFSMGKGIGENYSEKNRYFENFSVFRELLDISNFSIFREFFDISRIFRYFENYQIFREIFFAKKLKIHFRTKIENFLPSLQKSTIIPFPFRVQLQPNHWAFDLALGADHAVYQTIDSQTARERERSQYTF